MYVCLYRSAQWRSIPLHTSLCGRAHVKSCVHRGKQFSVKSINCRELYFIIFFRKNIYLLNDVCICDCELDCIILIGGPTNANTILLHTGEVQNMEQRVECAPPHPWPEDCTLSATLVALYYWPQFFGKYGHTIVLGKTQNSTRNISFYFVCFFFQNNWYTHKLDEALRL